MSRIGKKPIPISSGVDVKVDGGVVHVKGPKGELRFSPDPRMTVEVADSEVQVGRPGDDRESRALHGLTRSLIANMVDGVTTPFEKKLEINGTGYNATLAGKVLKLQVGFANTIELTVPEGVDCEVDKGTLVTVRSCDKQKCGQFAADIRAVRPPEPYKGKGIKYADEVIRRKAGKAMVG